NGQAKYGRGIRQRKSQRHHDKQKKRERRGQSRKLDRQIGGIAKRAEQFSSRCGCKPCSSEQLSARPNRHEEKENGETPKKKERRWQAGELDRDSENPSADYNEGKYQNDENRQQGAGRDREKDSQQIHTQHERPDQKRNFR